MSIVTGHSGSTSTSVVMSLLRRLLLLLLVGSSSCGLTIAVREGGKEKEMSAIYISEAINQPRTDGKLFSCIIIRLMVNL